MIKSSLSGTNALYEKLDINIEVIILLIYYFCVCYYYYYSTPGSNERQILKIYCYC